MKSRHYTNYNLRFLHAPLKGLSIFIIIIIITLILFNDGGEASNNNDNNVEVPRSVNDQYDWVYSEILFVDEIRNLDISRVKGQSFQKDIESYLDDFDDTVRGLKGYEDGGFPTEKASAILENPIATYRTLRRVAFMLPGLRKSIIFSDSYLLKYVKNFPGHYWVTAKDVEDHMYVIHRVQLVYDLDVEEFADGIISGIHTGAKLHGIHCYEIGSFAHLSNFYSLSILWLELALSKSLVDKTVDSHLVNDTLQAAVHGHDSAIDSHWERDPKYFTRKLINSGINSNSDGNFTSPSPAPAVEPRETRRKRLVKEFKGRKETDFNDINFWELCTNGGFKSVEEESKLFCWHETKVHAYWLINPLKMELLTRDPDVYQVYDVIGDEKISKLQEIATSTLKLSLVVDLDRPGKSTVSDVRTSMSTWIREELFPETVSLSLRIQQMTGINVVEDTSSENIQIASYSLGGHYDVHQDALKSVEQFGPGGERIATFMYYLSDVELGGYTAFPQARIAAVPVKGSAVFWYGIYTEGVADEDTYHGACPVVLGKKWVANKWIRYYDQFLIRKCSLKEKERFRVSVNNVELNV